MGRVVWAFCELDELARETGFIDVEDEELAARLIKAGKVQDPYDQDTELKHIEAAAPPAAAAANSQEYSTRELRARQPAKPAPPPRGKARRKGK